MDLKRRTALKSLLSLSSMGLAVCSGLLVPAKMLWAATWPKKAFQSTELDEAITNLFGTHQHQESDLISIKITRRVESGNSIPITISTALEHVRSIAIFIPNNTPLLAANFEIPEGTEPFIASRIKMATTGHVYAMVQTDDGLYSTFRKVKVLHGYCIEGLD